MSDKEKIRNQKKLYRETHKEEIRNQKKLYRETHKEEMKQYRETNKEKIKAQEKAYREEHKDQIKERARLWREANKARISELNKQNVIKTRELRKENKYQFGKIYKIESPSTENVYVGSTCLMYLCNRLSAHKTSYKTGKYLTSSEIVKFDDAFITLIENYPCQTQHELHERERYWIENTTNCINKTIPARSHEEYRETNREELKKKSQLWKSTHKEQIIESQRQYRNKNRDAVNANQRAYRAKKKHEAVKI